MKPSTLRDISIGLSIIVLAISIGTYGIANKKSISTILMVIVAIQISLFIIFLVGHIRRYMASIYVPIPILRFDNRIVRGHTNISPEYICATNPNGSSTLNISFEIKDLQEYPEFGILKINKNLRIEDIEKEILKMEERITEDKVTRFNIDIIINPEEKINFQFDRDVNLRLFTVHEMYKPY